MLRSYFILVVCPFYTNYPATSGLIVFSDSLAYFSCSFLYPLRRLHQCIVVGGGRYSHLTCLVCLPLFFFLFFVSFLRLFPLPLSPPFSRSPRLFLSLSSSFLILSLLSLSLTIFLPVFLPHHFSCYFFLLVPLLFLSLSPPSPLPPPLSCTSQQLSPSPAHRRCPFPAFAHAPQPSLCPRSLGGRAEGERRRRGDRWPRDARVTR